MSQDPEQEYFGDGFSEDLITDLSKLPGLSVIARQSSFSYKGSAIGISQISRELGADFLLEGSIRRAGDRVRINAQLVEGSTGKHLWAQRFDRQLENIFELQDDVNKRIVSALRIRLSTREMAQLSRRGTEVVDAYDYVLRGINETQTYAKEGSIRARYCFEQALKLDPRYSVAHARLAINYVYWWIVGWSDSREDSLDKGLEHAKRAVALDDEMPLCHVVLCWAYHWTGQFDDASAEGKRAVALDPNDVVALEFLALVTCWNGEPKLALEYLEKASRLNPHEPYYFGRGVARFAMGDYDGAVDVLRSSVELRPEFLPAQIYLASSYGLLGQADQARDIAANFQRIHHGSPRRAPYKHAKDRERMARGLKVAGLA